MSQPVHCPRCGAQLPGGTPPEACPRCLMKLGMEIGEEGEGEPEVVVTTHGHQAPPPAPEELAPHFPQLEILEVLGQGGMGVVYKARQKGLDRLVALKILSVEDANETAFAERFAREARALASLSHPNIVAVHDSGKAGDRYYLLMEFVEGTSLRQVIRAGNVAATEALHIVAQICGALQFAHEEGVVHRDIKPENILLDTKGRVKIADFGLAKLLRRAPAAVKLTGTYQAMGTPHYMAPEQIERPLDVDHRADIYSLGVVFYELLTGELPIGRFAAPSKKIELDVRVDDVVLRTLEKEPRLRYQQASQVKTDVEHIEETPGAAPARPRAQERDHAASVGPRRGWPWILGGGLFAFGSLVGVFAVNNGSAWPRYANAGNVIVALAMWSMFVVGAVTTLFGLSILFRGGHTVVHRDRRVHEGERHPGRAWVWLGIAVATAIVLLVVFAFLVYDEGSLPGLARHGLNLRVLVGGLALITLATMIAAIAIGSTRRRGAGTPARSHAWMWVVGLLLLIGAPFLLAAAGAAFLAFSPARSVGTGSLSAEVVETAPPSRGAAAVEGPVHTVFCDELEITRRIPERDWMRVKLDQLAHRRGLDAHEQVHLAEVILEAGTWDEISGIVLSFIQRQEPSDEVRARFAERMSQADREGETEPVAALLAEVDAPIVLDEIEANPLRGVPGDHPIHSTVCATIEEFAAYPPGAARYVHLERLASSDSLGTEHEQLHFIDAVSDGPSWKDSADHLVVLLESQVLAASARAAIRDGAATIGSEADRARVLAALDASTEADPAGEQ